MTQTMKHRFGWQRRGGVAAVGAALAVAAVFGPGTLAITRLGASEVAGYATVTAADTITSVAVLEEVAAVSRS